MRVLKRLDKTPLLTLIRLWECLGLNLDLFTDCEEGRRVGLRQIRMTACLLSRVSEWMGTGTRKQEPGKDGEMTHLIGTSTTTVKPGSA
jgi:hypothetical protein